MRFASIVKKVLAFLLCLTLLTSNVTVTNATSVDTTDVFAEVSTEMLKETKNAGQEENVSEADSDSNAADLSDTESNVSGQYKQSSDSDGTGDTEKVKNTESTEATEAIEETEKTEETEQPELKTVFDYSNDAVRVVVTLSNETDLPAGAELVVAPVAVTAEMEASIDKAMEGESKEKQEVVAYDISFVKDGKEVEVAKKLSSDIYAQDNSDTVLFTRFKMEELPKIRASKLDEIYDVDQKYYEALQESAETCIYNGKEIVTLDADLKEGMGEQRFLVDDEKNIGYTMKVERNKDGEIKESQLLSFKTGKKADGKCSVIAEDVDVMMGAKDGDIYYLTDMDEGMGDLYCNEELIDSDVMIGTLEFTKEQKYPIYKTDYNTSKNLFTLKMFDGKNAKVIADDAFDYKVVDEKKIAVLVDYDDDDSTGTLKLYRGKDKLIELDDDVTCLFGGMYN